MTVGLLPAPPLTSSQVLTKAGGGVAGMYLTTADIAAELGVKPATVSQWRSQSKAPGRYAATPFPAPDHVVGQSAAWRRDQLPEIRDWVAARPGPGAGGGRPRKTPAK